MTGKPSIDPLDVLARLDDGDRDGAERLLRAWLRGPPPGDPAWREARGGGRTGANTGGARPGPVSDGGAPTVEDARRAPTDATGRALAALAALLRVAHAPPPDAATASAPGPEPPGTPAPVERSAAPAARSTLEQAERVLSTMHAASNALAEGRVDELVSLARDVARRCAGLGAWVELHAASLLQAAYRFTGDPALRDEALAAGRRPADRVERPHHAVQARALMGSVHLMAGAYDAALDHCEAALDLARAAGIDGEPAAAIAHQFRAYVLFEWNRLDEAEGSLLRAWELAGSRGRGVRSGVARSLAGLYAARGREDEAALWLSRLEEIVAEPMTLRNREWLTATRLGLTLRSGDLREVERWLRAHDYRPETLADAARVAARLHELERVLHLLEITGQWSAVLALAPGLREATRAGRPWYDVRVVTVWAVALEAEGRAGEAEALFAEAMAVGEVGGFVRAYAEGGAVRRRLITRLAAGADAEARLRRIAEAAGVADAANRALLTPQQRSVLRLVAAGHSNKSVAREMGVSVNTVRTHLRAIFERLGVGSRTQAVARARESRLL